MARKAFPSDPGVAMFAGAAGRAAVFELKTRMFADAVALKGAVSASLDPLTKDVLAWIVANTTTSAEDCEKVTRAARLRNKLFHLELSRATGQLVSLDVQLNSEGVKMFSWDGAATVEKVLGAIAAGGAPVARTATRDGLVFGWLLEASASGAFGAAARIFDEASQILERALPGYGEDDEAFTGERDVTP